VGLGKIVDHFVTQRIRKDGRSIDVSVTLSPVCDSRGHIVAVSKIVRSVTSARQRHGRHDSMTPATPKVAISQPASQPKQGFGGSTVLSAHTNRALSEKLGQFVRNSKPWRGSTRK
jgi:hypothetical protein